MNNNNKPFGWRRNLDYLKENIVIMWKSTVEYKTNFYSSLTVQVFFVISYILFFHILYINFKDVVSWSFEEYLLFFLIYDVMFVILGVFAWKRENLKSTLLTGRMNSFLVRPIRPFYGYTFSNLSSFAFIMVIMNLLTFPVLFYIFEYSLHNVLISIFILIIISFLAFMFETIYTSIALLSIGISGYFLGFYYETNSAIRSYPFEFFSNIKSSHFLLVIFPGLFVSSFLMPILFEKSVINFKLQIIIMVSLIFILIGILYLMWKIGLKKYEAFG